MIIFDFDIKSESMVVVKHRLAASECVHTEINCYAGLQFTDSHNFSKFLDADNEAAEVVLFVCGLFIFVWLVIIFIFMLCFVYRVLHAHILKRRPLASATYSFNILILLLKTKGELQKWRSLQL